MQMTAETLESLEVRKEEERESVCVCVSVTVVSIVTIEQKIQAKETCSGNAQLAW